MTQQTTIEFDELPIVLDLPPVKKGADYSFTIEMLDDNDAAKDTTGWTMQVTGRDAGANGDELFSLTVGDGITHTPSQGRFVVKIAKTITATLPATRIVWDCAVTDSNGDVSYPFEGTLQILPSVTRL